MNLLSRFSTWRINRLKVKLAGLKAKLEYHSHFTKEDGMIPASRLDERLSMVRKIAELETKLALLGSYDV